MKILEIDYLESADLTDEDLHYLFDLNGISYSFINYLLMMAGENFSKSKLTKTLKRDNSWLNNHALSKKDIHKCKKRFTKCISNIYQFNYETSKRWVNDWYMYYGLSSRINADSF